MLQSTIGDPEKLRIGDPDVISTLLLQLTPTMLLPVLLGLLLRLEVNVLLLIVGEHGVEELIPYLLFAKHLFVQQFIGERARQKLLLEKSGLPYEPFPFGPSRTAT